MKKLEAIEYTEKLLGPIAQEMNYEIVDVEYEKEGSNWYLRVYADKEGGFTINDCVALSRALEAAMKDDDPFTDPYILEVSSPGLERPLKKAKDFYRSLGKLVDIKLYKADAECALEREFQATLKSYDEENNTITIVPENETTEHVVGLDKIAMIRLAFVM